MTKRILQIGDVAGGPQTLAKYQRKLGYTSDTLSFYQHKYNYGLDFYLPHKTFLPNIIEKIFKLLKFSPNYDIYHFHVGTAGLEGLDLAVWKMLGKTAVIHYHGSEIRGKKDRYFYQKLSDAIIVSTPDLLQYTSNAVLIPIPADLEALPYIGVCENPDTITIVHAPSDRKIKGTHHVIQAVKTLKDDGYNVTLLLIENMVHDKALEYYKKADIVVGWINPNFGIYANVSIENMAMGKPVICSINPNYVHKYYKNLPICNSNPENLVENLRILIEDYKLRKKLGEKGRKYVEEIHDGDKIAKKVLSLYDETG